MSDRELIELAAKAVGLFLVGYDEINGKGIAATEMPIKNLPFGWNPLTDDGDALRLAVKCKIDLILTHSDCESAFDHKCIQYAEPTTPDPCAATRRAIVRAAAEIGKEMP